jgi:Domain of unknown function (DUF1918)
MAEKSSFTAEEPLRSAVGCEILVASSGHSSTSPDRRGRIVRVLGPPGCESFLVRWSDGRESVLHRGAGTVVGRQLTRPGRR